jgi:hypothetical protein
MIKFLSTRIPPTICAAWIGSLNTKYAATRVINGGIFINIELVPAPTTAIPPFHHNPTKPCARIPSGIRITQTDKVLTQIDVS